MEQQQEQTSAQDDGFEWAVVEIFGHRRHAGRAREEERFGAKMLRVDVPKVGWQPGEKEGEGEFQVNGWTTHFYGGASIFSYTLTNEASALKINRPYVPAARYLAPPDAPDDADDDVPFDEFEAEGR